MYLMKEIISIGVAVLFVNKVMTATFDDEVCNK